MAAADHLSEPSRRRSPFTALEFVGAALATVAGLLIGKMMSARVAADSVVEVMAGELGVAASAAVAVVVVSLPVVRRVIPQTGWRQAAAVALALIVACVAVLLGDLPAGKQVVMELGVASGWLLAGTLAAIALALSAGPSLRRRWRTRA